MKVRISDERNSVVLRKDDHIEKNACGWASSCPSDQVRGLYHACSECPAGQCREKIFTHEQAVAWWEKQ